MKHKTLGTGIGLLIAFLAVAGLTTAQPLALVTGDGGGEAHGQLDGEYYADASGAVDATHENYDDAHGQASATARQASQAFEDAKWDAWDNASAIERPQMPECACDELDGQLDQAGTMQASHADRVHKAADVDTEYVDAGADVTGVAEASAWYENLFEGVTDAVDEIQDRLEFETNADDEAKDTVEETLRAEDELRGDLVDEATDKKDLPDAQPSVEGALDAEHASQVTSSATGHAQGQIP